MRMLSAVLVSLHLAPLAAAQDAGAARVDRDAVVRHYEAVEAELRLAPAPRDAGMAARRNLVIDALRDYRERGDFGINRAYDGSRVPLFVDGDGRRCAVAWLLDRTGQGELTLAIQRRCNEAWVAELAGDPALQSWLAHHGLSAEEAARIQAPGSGWVTIEPPPEIETAQVNRPESGPGNGVPAAAQPRGGSRTPASPPPAAGTPAGTGPRTGTIRGLSPDALENASWLDWWEWNRAVFEPPQRANVVTPATRTSASVSPQRTEATELLATLSASPHAQVRAAAVLALGRIGAAPDQLGKHFDDSAREVRLATLLGLGSGGTAAHAHMLATRAGQPQQAETLAVALAGMAALEAGPMQRALGSTVTGFLGDQRLAVHTAAALAAGNHADDTLRAAARKLLKAADAPAERAGAASLLGQHADNEDVATLTALANDRSIEVRRSASLALGRSKHPLALPALQSAFELEHESVTRSLQLLAIGDHGGDAGKAFLIATMTAGSKPMRAHAALALGLWGHGRDAGDAAERVVSAHLAERNRDQKGAYLLSLGLLRHVPARELLAGELREGSTSSTRGAAAMALGLLGDRASLPALQQALGTDSCPWVRQQVARAMTSLGGDAIDALITTMQNDKDAKVQAAAAFALGGLTDGRAAAALLTFAADDDAPAAARAGAALGLGRHFRTHEPRLPALRFQQNHLLLPSVAAWAFAQEL